MPLIRAAQRSWKIKSIAHCSMDDNINDSCPREITFSCSNWLIAVVAPSPASICANNKFTSVCKSFKVKPLQ